MADLHAEGSAGPNPRSARFVPVKPAAADRRAVGPGAAQPSMHSLPVSDVLPVRETSSPADQASPPRQEPQPAGAALVPPREHAPPAAALAGAALAAGQGHARLAMAARYAPARAVPGHAPLAAEREREQRAAAY